MENTIALFVLGLTMIPRENKNNAHAKFGGQTKGIKLWYFPKWPMSLVACLNFEKVSCRCFVNFSRCCRKFKERMSFVAISL